MRAPWARCGRVRFVRKRRPVSGHTLSLVAVTGVTAGLLAGCSGEPDSEAALGAVVAVEAPGPGWSPGGDGLLDFDDGSGPARREGEVWSPVTSSDSPATYVTTWSVPVPAGEDATWCAEAAAWLVEVGPDLPGEPLEAFEDEEPPTLEASTEDCTSRLAQVRDEATGTASTTTFGSWPNTASDGYQFGHYLEVRGDDAEVTLIVTFVAQPAAD